ncbi:hypothetical protein [Tardiphaga sp. 862_B3_N1_1]|uniref:hypothetical protein n=1 Tax=Tardiphaga sp. 862_B3_N1_1 TaxID=3240763 RepID=UPI003F88F7A1
MPKVVCTLPHASLLISGVKFTPSEDGTGVVSEEVSQTVADGFLAIPGYHLEGDEQEDDAAQVSQAAKAPAPAAAPKAPAAPKPAAKKKEAKEAPAPAPAPAAEPPAPAPAPEPEQKPEGEAKNTDAAGDKAGDAEEVF